MKKSWIWLVSTAAPHESMRVRLSRGGPWFYYVCRPRPGSQQTSASDRKPEPIHPARLGEKVGWGRPCIHINVADGEYKPDCLGDGVFRRDWRYLGAGVNAATNGSNRTLVRGS